MYKLIMKWFSIDDLSCQATINSIYVSISSVAEMLKYGYTCSESDVHKEVEIEFVFFLLFLICSDSSCHIKGKSGFLELVRKVKTTHQFAMNHFGRMNSIRIWLYR